MCKKCKNDINNDCIICWPQNLKKKEKFPSMKTGDKLEKILSAYLISIYGYFGLQRI